MRSPVLDWREWLLSAACIAFFLGAVWVREPQKRYGHYHDDALYSASARAIADGKGYIQPNLPGSPPATKYPPGYPYALALAMAVYPGFYEDPAQLWVLSAAAGALALVVAYLYMRSWKVPLWAAGAALILCVTQQVLPVVSGAVLSDAPFMALALLALYLADRDGPKLAIVLAAAGCAGAAVLTRSVGIAIPAAIAGCYLLRREHRSAAIFTAAVAPFALIGVAVKLAAVDIPAEAAQGYRQTFQYYSDYVGFWRASVPDMGVFVDLVSKNLGYVMRVPAEILIGTAPGSFVGRVAWVSLTAAAVSGAVRQMHQDRVRPVHFAFVLTFCAALLWNYEIADRLLLVFAPFLALGLVVEAGHMATNFWRTFRTAKPIAERAISAAFLALIAGFVLYAANRTVRAHWAAAALERQSFDEKYAELFVWMRENTNPEDRFIAIDDGVFYLRTGRQGMWPLALTTEPRYRPDKDRLQAQMDLLPDVAEHIGARYAIQADHDYAFAPLARERWLGWTADLPVLAESADGTARILDLRCRPHCGAPPKELSAVDAR